jgi:hypothetical protein
VRARELDHNDPLVKDAVFGKQVEDFLHSDVGDYLLAQARREGAEALEKLKVVEPNAEQDIRALQSIIARSDSFQTWLGQAVEDGLRATNQLDGEEDS